MGYGGIGYLTFPQVFLKNMCPGENVDKFALTPD